ncbi:MFS transporter [Natrononativus amylolyticus]|uniref:MFS transporter n=1 Tax=Natrononativus amylolyticus TaxID=2963434 RepID=UPI0020CD4D11|nr:MFS transporter [Natrononativus amylolyticus]
MRGVLRNRTFRRLFAGRVITNIGDSFYFVAAMWLVYSLTNDPVYTGIAGFVTMAPQAFQFLAGPLVDRWSIRRTLVSTQLIQAVVVSSIPIAYVFGFLTVELILVVMPVLSALNQLVYPAQIAALPRILDDEELVAANSLFSVAYQGFEMVANGIGGVLIGLFGAVALFALDVITFGIAAIVFATVSIPSANMLTNDDQPEDTSTLANDEGQVENGGDSLVTDGDGTHTETEDSGSYLIRMREGVSVLRGTFLVPLLAGAVVANFSVGMMLAATPAYADSLAVPIVLSQIGAAGTYGILMGSIAAGSFVGAIATNLVANRPLGRSAIVGYTLAGVLWSGALLADWLPLTALLFALANIPIGILSVQVAAAVQSAPPAEMVGRVSSIHGSASASMVPIGSLTGGVFAGWFSPQAAMAALGFAAFSLALYVLMNPELRELPSPGRVTID